METPEALTNIYCSEEISRGLQNQIICLSAINTLFDITAIVGNIVILNALHKETSLHLPSNLKVLLQNLVASDLCVGAVELVLVGEWISIL